VGAALGCVHGDPSGRLPLEGPSDGLYSDGIQRKAMCDPVARLYAAIKCRVGFSRGLLERPLFAARHKTMLSTRNKARHGLLPRCLNTWHRPQDKARPSVRVMCSVR
jgi:hypothetical protein